MSIHYILSITQPDAHLIDVVMTLTDLNPDGQVLKLPNWIPGSYMIRDFSRHIVSITASCGDQAIALSKQDKSTWQLPPGLAEASIHYQIYAWELSVRAAHVDRTHAFFNGTSVFLCALGFEHQPHSVEFVRPSNERFELATTLPAHDVDNVGFGVYRAADYDELIDHPVEMGCFKRLNFVACGVPHQVVLSGDCHFDESRVVQDLQQVCEYQIQFFGEPAPFSQYLFLVTVVGQGYGGLEHRSSTALMISRDNLPATGAEQMDDAYLEFLGLCSHEYFHNWNVKRIKPARFIPYALESESYTRLLWFFEGVTSYYDDLMLVRSGLIGHEKYLQLLAKTLSRVQRGAGRLRQSVTDSSFDAWHKFYKQDENAPNAIVSYYSKGALVALCLDSHLRALSQGQVTLDDVMRRLWSQWLEDTKGLDETEPERVASELLGHDLQSFFGRCLYSCEELPLSDALLELGVGLSWQVRTSAKDMGGVRSASDKSLKQAWLGAVFSEAPGGVRITQVLNGSPAEQAGLAAGDTLIAVCGLSVNTGDLEKHLTRYADQDHLDVHYFRSGQLYTGMLPVQPLPLDTAVLQITDEGHVNGWLSSVETH